MGIQQPNLRAHTILDSTSGKAYYVLVTLLEDRTEFEESSINLRVTDGSSCWGREDLRRQPAPKNWMRNVYSALSGASQGTYEIQVQSSSDGLKVTIRWHEAALRVRASVSLPAAKEDCALPSMLNTLFQSFAAMQEAYAEMASLEAELRCRADSSQAELQKLVDSKDKREQELYIKFAAVVNETKQKLWELQQRIQELEEFGLLFAAVVNEKKQKLRELQQRIHELEEQAEEGPDQDNASGAGSPPRGTVDADHDSVYDAETEPSAGESEAQRDLEDTYQTQQRPAAGTFGIDETLASHDRAQSQDDGKAPTTRLQAERDALLAAETQPMERDENDSEDEEMQQEVPTECEAHTEHEAAPQEQPSPAAKPPAKPSGLAKRRRR